VFFVFIFLQWHLSLRVPAASWLAPELSWSHFRQQCAVEARRAGAQHERALVTKLIDTEVGFI
jgi:hypothetical protein